MLITGGAGFIGSHLARHLQPHCRVRVLDNFRTGHRRNLAGLTVDLIEGSICDPDAVARAVDGVDTVYHLAALVSVPESVANPSACLDLNVLGLLNVLSAAEIARVRKLVFASSAAVYGDNPAVPKREDMLPEPRSPYAVTKLDGEFYCAQFAERGPLETACLRFFNVFGPGQDPSGPYGAAVPIFFREALAGRPLRIHGDGGQTRDFIHVDDIAGALAFASRPGIRGVFNAGYGGQITIHELAATIIAATGSRSTIEFSPPRPGDVRHSRADAGKLRQAGWTPRGDLHRGLLGMAAELRRDT